MKSINEIKYFINERIKQIYLRPKMFGCDSTGVDLILYNYHEIWAEINESNDTFRNLYHQIIKEEDGGSAKFASNYKKNNTNANDDKVIEYVISEWKKISSALKLYFD